MRAGVCWAGRACAIATLSWPAAAFAQWNPEVPGTATTIQSAALAENRTVHVVLPDGYETRSNIRYDVLYVLDAEDDGKRMLEIVRYLHERQGFIPPLIIVNVWTIARWDRDNNFTPTFVSDSPTSGGAGRFLAFLRDELIPYIDRTYATSGENTLHGHSYGGLFAMYAMLEAPELFHSYVLTDPSLYWDDGHLSRLAKRAVGNPALTGRTLWIGTRDGLDHVKMGGADMERVLRAHAPAGLRWRSERYADETHFSILLKAAYDGLKFTYSGFPGLQPLEYLPTAGLVDIQRPFPFLVIFVLNSDGSRLSVGGHEIIGHDGLNGPWVAKDFMLPLEKGLHAIRLEYFQRGEGAHLQLRYIAPGSDEPRAIPTSRQLR